MTRPMSLKPNVYNTGHRKALRILRSFIISHQPIIIQLKCIKVTLRQRGRVFYACALAIFRIDPNHQTFDLSKLQSRSEPRRRCLPNDAFERRYLLNNAFDERVLY